MALAEFSWSTSENRPALPRIGITSTKLSDEVLINNARWFIVFRWGVIGVLILFQLAAIIIPDKLTEAGVIPQQGWSFVITLVLCMVNASCIYALDFCPRSRYNSPSINIWIQIIVDLVCLSVVVHFVGSIATPAPFFYVLHIALSCIFFSAAESLIVTLLVCCLYAAILFIETPLLFLVPQSVSIGVGTLAAHPHKIDILLWMFTLDVLFVVVWYVVSRLAIVVRTREHQLLEAYEQISRAQMEKDRYAVLMTHQLKAPLDAIRSKINIMKGGYCGEISTDMEDVLLKIDHRASGMASLILDVLKLERLRAAVRSGYAREHVSIEATIRKCTDKLMPIAHSRNIGIKVKIEDFIAEGLRSQLEILFENVIANAIAYSYDGGTIEIASILDDVPSSAVVAVTDHGIGIGEKDLPHIFDEYFYAPRAALHNRTSSGIGLSIVKTVAENNRLRLRVSSVTGNGTVFSIIFQDVTYPSPPQQGISKPDGDMPAAPADAMAQSPESSG
ncbi:sensor histidine kinase KdpD [Nitrosovibrio sp. Nv17]|uniref:sensor histidine kinase n=1 Tax=Nitrosovibrio sp. Nv17 TaxID=1855339 RepID=UPI00090858CA|nr:HAMP domain-containing sensor histidine kinase [Nitrosovibrio sp. Nv17]SFW19482.1 Signal transduction histidine kinase [Nitrosovibrio sp. Nv17]